MKSVILSCILLLPILYSADVNAQVQNIRGRPNNSNSNLNISIPREGINYQDIDLNNFDSLSEYYSPSEQRPLGNVPGTVDCTGEGIALKNGTCVNRSIFCKNCITGECRQICGGYGGPGVKECTENEYLDSNGDCIPRTPNPSPDPEPPPGASQEALAQQAVQACQSAEAQVRSSCDSESKSWLQEINNVMGGVMPAIQAQQNTKAMMENKKSACGKLVAAESGVKGALATFQIMCANASNNCNKQCDPALVSLPYYRSQLETSKKACNDKAISAKESYARAAQASQEIMVAVQSCRAMMEIEVTDLPECSKPENINNPGCAVNLGTPIQVSAAAIQPSTGSGALNHQGALDKTATDMGSDKGFGLDPDDENREVTPHKSNPGEEIGGSKGGGNVASSSGTGGGGASGRDGGGQPKGLISNILSGFFGGGGGGTGGGGRSGGWRALFGGGSGSQPTAQAQNKMPDLRQFMPGGAHDPNRHRGIAGQFIGKDGMSGPHSNIWKMINNRYQYKRATLLP